MGKKVKVGHAGTLDNQASGLVIAAVGPATRLLQNLEVQDKEYTFTLHLGLSTLTGQHGDEVTEEKECSVSADEVIAVLDQFRGKISQVPPLFSAVKINGKRASDRAIRGQEVELKSRDVTIKSLDYLGLGENPNEFLFKVHCTKGTYVRSLGRDIGKTLGLPACVSKIHRTKIGSLKLEEATKWDSEELLEKIISPEKIVSWPSFEIDETQWTSARHGNKFVLEHEDLPTERENIYLTYEGQLVAFAEWKTEGYIQPRVVFNNE